MSPGPSRFRGSPGILFDAQEIVTTVSVGLAADVAIALGYSTIYQHHQSSSWAPPARAAQSPSTSRNLAVLQKATGSWVAPPRLAGRRRSPPNRRLRARGFHVMTMLEAGKLLRRRDQRTACWLRWTSRPTVWPRAATTRPGVALRQARGRARAPRRAPPQPGRQPGGLRHAGEIRDGVADEAHPDPSPPRHLQQGPRPALDNAGEGDAGWQPGRDRLLVWRCAGACIAAPACTVPDSLDALELRWRADRVQARATSIPATLCRFDADAAKDKGEAAPRSTN